MPDPLPACFAAGPPTSTSAGPTTTTSVYETPAGVASLTWSRTVLGLLVRAVIRLDDDDDDEAETLAFKIRPWLLWKRRGSKRIHVSNRVVDVSWDLSRAQFPLSGGAEPSSGYSLSISLDGDVILAAGESAPKSKKASLIDKTPLISRKEHVAMGEDKTYTTTVRFGGKERSISIDLDGEMILAVDGKQIVQIRRLRWKFRGSERVDLGGGDWIHISWDLHDWLFPTKSSEKGSSSSPSHAIFVFKFENEDGEEEGHFGKEWYFGKNWSESGSSNGEKKKTKKRLSKTGSSSSLSSASSAGSSTVMEWASVEEAELRGRRGFSLLVYAWKS